MDMMTQLAARFGPDDLEWKPQTIGVTNGKPWCQIVPYISARAVYQRLDECFGIFGWSLTTRPEKIGDADGCIATLSLIREDGRTVTREDGSEPSDIDSYKGAISGAVKRVAVTLGIGRYLYELDGPVYATIHEGGKTRARGKTKKGDEYDFKWDVPPAILAKLTRPPNVDADGVVKEKVEGVTESQMEELAGVAASPVWTDAERTSLLKRGGAMKTEKAMTGFLEKAIAEVVTRTKKDATEREVEEQMTHERADRPSGG